MLAVWAVNSSVLTQENHAELWEATKRLTPHFRRKLVYMRPSYHTLVKHLEKYIQSGCQDTEAYAAISKLVREHKPKRKNTNQGPNLQGIGGVIIDMVLPVMRKDWPGDSSFFLDTLNATFSPT